MLAVQPGEEQRLHLDGSAEAQQAGRMDGEMNRKEIDKVERREVSRKDFTDALQQMLASKELERPRSENREPTKAELERRYKLDRKC